MRFNTFTQTDTMRLYLSFTLFLVLLSCKSKSIIKNESKATESQLFKLEKCTINTACSIEIKTNSTLAINPDHKEKPYLEITSGDNIIIKYELKRIELTNTADAHYSELLYFEIDKNENHLNLTNEALRNTNMIYGRFCYCKDGTSGYFKVNQGNLKLTKDKKKLHIDLNFNVGKIPQQLTQIKETILLQ